MSTSNTKFLSFEDNFGSSSMMVSQNVLKDSWRSGALDLTKRSITFLQSGLKLFSFLRKK